MDMDLNDLCKKAIEKYPDQVQQYKNGKKGLVGLFVGEVMKSSNGKADPKQVNEKICYLLHQ